MKLYYIKHLHPETASHSEQRTKFVYCYWLHTKHKHLHDKISVLPMGAYLKLHATQLKQMTQTQTYSLHYLNACSDPQIN